MMDMTTQAGEPRFGTRMTLEEWANMPELAQATDAPGVAIHERGNG